MTSSQKILNYVIYNPRTTLTLDLYEAERYEPAIIVQSLIGNLVYYSNQGRYEPRLAKTWQRTSPDTWEFEIYDNLVCEDGEKITPTSFKSSLQKIIKFLSKSGDVPILNLLDGYDQFISGSDQITGLTTFENKLIFKFKKPVRSGLVQILSFAPFGYICSGNLNADGSWKDNKAFISSGPYRLKNVQIGKEYVLEKRNNWALNFSKSAPDIINFTHAIPNTINEKTNFIIDAFTSDIQPPTNLKKYPLVPEYINPIVLGNLKHGYFADIKNRQFIRKIIEAEKASLPNSWGPHTKSNSFYPNQSQKEQTFIDVDAKINLPSSPLVIEGTAPEEKTPRWYSWNILKTAFDKAGILYKFEGNETTMRSIGNQNFDIRIRGSSIGGGVEVWGLNVLFCSDLGPRFPDPSGSICNAVKDYENEKIDEITFAEIFLKAVHNDCAIIPISHYGIQLFMTEGIDRQTISPALEIVRFDQMNIE